jgi:hypothetical protein
MKFRWLSLSFALAILLTMLADPGAAVPLPQAGSEQRGEVPPDSIDLVSTVSTRAQSAGEVLASAPTVEGVTVEVANAADDDEITPAAA